MGANLPDTMEPIDERILEVFDDAVATGRAREQLRSAVREFAALLCEWSQHEHSLEGIRWRVGDWILHAEARYGEETTATIAEVVHEYLTREHGLRITLNMVYKSSTLARMFPPRYRYPHVPYSVYQILGEVHVGSEDAIERLRRRRELVEAYAQLRKDQFLPVDYHAIKAFAEAYLQERYQLPARTPPSRTRIPERPTLPPAPPAPREESEPISVEATLWTEPSATRWERWRLETDTLGLLLELRGTPETMDALAPALETLRQTLLSLGLDAPHIQRYPEPSVD